MHGITMGLINAGHEVKVLCICTPKHPLEIAAMPKEYRDATGIEGIFTDTSLNIVDAFADLVTAANYNISRCRPRARGRWPSRSPTSTARTFRTS